jgi:hypothetical protein
MPDKERVRLNGKGIFTINQLSYTFRPRRRIKRSSMKTGDISPLVESTCDT